MFAPWCHGQGFHGDQLVALCRAGVQHWLRVTIHSRRTHCVGLGVGMTDLLTEEGLKLSVSTARRLLPTPGLHKEEPDEDYLTSCKGMGAAVERAKERGLICVYGTEDTLLLDLDDGAVPNVVMLAKLEQLLGPWEMQSWRSKSGTGQHVVLRFPDKKFTPAQAMVLETALGSDPFRSVLGVMRLLNGVKEPRVLFRPPTG